MFTRYVSQHNAKQHLQVLHALWTAMMHARPAQPQIVAHTGLLGASTEPLLLCHSQVLYTAGAAAGTASWATATTSAVPFQP